MSNDNVDVEFFTSNNGDGWGYVLPSGEIAGMAEYALTYVLPVGLARLEEKYLGNEARPRASVRNAYPSLGVPHWNNETNMCSLGAIRSLPAADVAALEAGVVAMAAAARLDRAGVEAAWAAVQHDQADVDRALLRATERRGMRWIDRAMALVTAGVEPAAITGMPGGWHASVDGWRRLTAAGLGPVVVTRGYERSGLSGGAHEGADMVYDEVSDVRPMEDGSIVWMENVRSIVFRGDSSGCIKTQWTPIRMHPDGRIERGERVANDVGWPSPANWPTPRGYNEWAAGRVRIAEPPYTDAGGDWPHSNMLVSRSWFQSWVRAIRN
jgi:hypothetical protein